MKALFRSCQRGTWKRLGVASAACCSALLALGCSFNDYSSTLEPACRTPMPVSDAGQSRVHWTFDDSFNNGQSLDTAGGNALMLGHDSSPPVAVLTPNPRIDGDGDSLYLDGHQYAQSVDTLSDGVFLESQFTIAAFVSLPVRVFTSDGPAPFTWTLVSTGDATGQCGGYQLDIGQQSATEAPALTLSYWTSQSVDGGEPECVKRFVSAPFNVPSWATGTGRWHHVAASYLQLPSDDQFPNDPARVQLALFWDGKRLEPDDPTAAHTLGAIVYPTDNRALYIGTDANSRESDAPTKFTGYIDELAVVEQALTETELAEYVATSTTHPGPDNCNWRASESWDGTASTASSTQWLSSGADALSVKINDWNWGAGALDALLWPPKDLRLYDKAILEANIPSGQGFQFTLASGDDYCSWTYLGRGQDSYEIDLRHPVSCVSSSCAIDFSQVDRASITSEWAISNDDATVRRQGLETFVVRQLGFEANVGDPIDWTSYGGVIGPMGYCWRLQGYEPETRATWQQGTTSWNDSVTAVLSGPIHSGTRLVADFGDRIVDLSGCQSADIDADLQSVGNQYSFVVQDVYGSWRSWDLSNNVPDSTHYVVGQLGAPNHASGIKDDANRPPNFAGFPDSLVPQKVSLFGVQKPWYYAGQVSVTLRSVTFRDANGNVGCERAGVN